MNKLSKRLESLISFIDKEDSLVDIGCDHAYLSIYLYKNNLVKNVICSDISANALEYAKKNIKKENLNIKTYLSNGLNEIPLENIDTILISGMGTKTIIDILNDKEKLKNINKIIIQTNNDYKIMRSYMNKIGYYLIEEKEVLDNNIWYISMKYIKSNVNNTNNEITYGYLNDKDYYDYLMNYYHNILIKIPKSNKDYRKYEQLKKELENYYKK